MNPARLLGHHSHLDHTAALDDPDTAAATARRSLSAGEAEATRIERLASSFVHYLPSSQRGIFPMHPHRPVLHATQPGAYLQPGGMCLYRSPMRRLHLSGNKLNCFYFATRLLTS